MRSIESRSALELCHCSSVHLKQEEKLTVRCGRDGGVETLEVLGMIMLRVKSEDFGRVLVAVDNREKRNIQLQVEDSITGLSFATQCENRL